MKAKEIKRLEDITQSIFSQDRVCVDWGYKKDIGYLLSKSDYEFIKPILMAEYKTTYEIGGVKISRSGVLSSGRIYVTDDDGIEKVLIPVVSDIDQVEFACHFLHIAELMKSGFCKKIKYSEFAKPREDGEDGEES